MTSQFLGIKAQVSLETLRELLTSEGTTSRTPSGGKNFRHGRRQLPSTPRHRKGEVQQDVSTAGAGRRYSACRCRREHDEPDGNVLSRGEGAPSPAWLGKIDQAQATRRKRLRTCLV